MFLMFHNIVHFIVQHQFADVGTLTQAGSLTVTVADRPRRGGIGP